MDNNSNNPYLSKRGDPQRTGNYPAQPNNPYLSGGGDPARTGNVPAAPRSAARPSVYQAAVNESLTRPRPRGEMKAAVPGALVGGAVKRFGGRVADSFRRTPTMYNAAASKALGDNPEDYAYRTSENVFTEPARGTMDKIADGVGNLAAQISDPISIATSLVTGGPVSGAVLGGAFEGGKSLLVDSARGDPLSGQRAAGAALGGAVGGGLTAGAVPVGVFGNDLAETTMRSVGSEAVEGANPVLPERNHYLAGMLRRQQLLEAKDPRARQRVPPRF